MKATVDPDICQGHARCWEICPEVFTLDEEGHSHVTLDTIPPELQDDTQEAADNCPERAIVVQ
jgi:ferredoxin